MLHPPFSSWDAAKNAVGIEVDIVNLAAKNLGRTVQWQEMDFPDLFEAIATGKVDIAVSTIGRTEERRKKVDFSKPYYETYIVCLVAPESKHRSLSDLQESDIKIGADKTTTSYAAAKHNFPTAQIVEAAKTGSSWPQMLHDGSIDGFVVDASDQHRLESTTGLKLRRIETTLATEAFAVAVHKGDTTLKSAMDEAVDEIKPSVKLRIGNKPQLVSPLGREITSLKSPPLELVKNYLAAQEAYRNQPDNVEAAIWFARRAGYLQRMNEAIEILSIAIENHPDDARLYRHRGHRYISIRQFDKAIHDLETAVELIEGEPDSVEPDGVPNSEGIPLTTTHGNIWYHLGLAYYLKNDTANALRCYAKRVPLEKYDDNYVANGHWLYMICRRRYNKKMAEKTVSKVRKNMRIIENMSYHKMCLFYHGQITESELDRDTDGSAGSDVILYGLGNWYLYEQKNREKARIMFEKLFQSGSPFSFAYIAAESDYARLYK